MFPKPLDADKDRLKLKDLASEAWSVIDEVHQNPLLPLTEIDNSSVIIDIKTSVSITKEDSHQSQSRLHHKY